ncbi:hypothetical protein KEM60_02077 [Austwickia sp. TVS 96-490-7B]|nr:hypothetical protein [Austwickia sp. TVS 96-490-7B]
MSKRGIGRAHLSAVSPANVRTTYVAVLQGETVPDDIS